MSSSEYYTFLGTTCDWKCHNSVENENIFSCDNVMLDYFLAWSHIFAYFNFYKIHLVVKHPVYNSDEIPNCVRTVRCQTKPPSFAVQNPRWSK